MIEVARLHKVDSDGSLKAFADVIINQVLVKGIRVVEGKENGLFVSMPKNQGKDSRWYETISLLNEEDKQELQEAVLEAFNV